MINAEDLVGKCLVRVTTSWHHYQETKPSLLHLWMHMEGLGPVRFHTVGDGLSMEIDQPHGPYDMDEYGHTTVEDDLPDFPMTRFVGRRILSVREIRYRHDNLDFAIGVTLRFETGSIRVLNLADEIVLARDAYDARDARDTHDEHLGPVESYLRAGDEAQGRDASPWLRGGQLTERFQRGH
ncbi:hypothetical protein [Streptomyces sp. NPDC003077]|uniref:hypothetical protein n=1 Tax=Streptomyces sp. NPDC003077 TaxID=3154443 RepID=UPI0033A14CCC